ncbi:MAG: SdiA-regulated domain-containing protein [Myxococcaceae bacterium]|nr:SdiA-regulated domain-containing protein [Myxococcaceae bacterium]
MPTTSAIRLGDVTFNRLGARAGDQAPTRFEPAARIKTSVPEASDVVALANGSFAVVSDVRDSLFIIDAKGKQTKLKLEGMKNASELEGVAYDPVKQHLFVSREESRELYRYSWAGGTDTPKLEKKIGVELKGPENKGLEGLAYLPAELSPTGQAQLLATKEGSPRQLLLFADNGKGKPLEVELEKQIKDVLADFSAAAVDPKTGNVYLASDESSMIAQLRLVRDGQKVRARIIQALPVRDEKGKPLARIEGLTFNGRGDLFVLTENDGALHALKRK